MGKDRVVVLELAVALQEATDVEMLVLKGVGELVRHDRLLLIEREPAGDEERLLGRVVVAAHLLGQEPQREFLVIHLGWEQAELLEEPPLALELTRVVLLANPLVEVAGDLFAALDPLGHTLARREAAQLNHLAEHLVGSLDQIGPGRVLADLCRHESERAENDRAGGGKPDQAPGSILQISDFTHVIDGPSTPGPANISLLSTRPACTLTRIVLVKKSYMQD